MQYFPELFETLLRERGIMPEEKEDFLNPDYEKLHDPLLLPDMSEARDRVIRAIKNNEHVAVFSDYDCDGLPGAVVLSDFFSRIGFENISFYIPHRHDEGFGLNEGAIKEIAGRNAKVIITVDCGISDNKEVALAGELGIDVIITDHHQPNTRSAGGLPNAYAIINQNREDSSYPFKGLCGAAIAFKLVQAIMDREPFGVRPGMEKWSLDMVAVATLSDMVPLLGENRILASFGLTVLRKSPRPGLAALFKRMSIDQSTVSEDDVTFMITPRINAASRMGVPEDAFNLLKTKDHEEAERLALHLEKINNERKGVVASVVKEAKSKIASRQELNSVIVIGNPEWRPALLGLVANSLAEEYQRPAFVWGRSGDGTLKGSSRSYNGYDLFALMSAASDEFIEFGGHAGAGGFSVTLESLTTLEERLSRVLKGMEIGTEVVLDSHLEIKLDDIGDHLWSLVSSFSPFGMGNKKPIFKIPKAEIKSVKQFGRENNHLEVIFNGGDKEVKAIAFFTDPASYSTLLTPGSRISLLANLEKSFFRTRSELRLRIVDIMQS